jgi:hypothetical protein
MNEQELDALVSLFRLLAEIEAEQAIIKSITAREKQ